ncbi:hypothetical protein EYZ11_013358 [Aspergillus tanneri]|uniref:Uncharacterized protein n=1 Tax=Aspergillus tanneri TaxID=1220188 RepID=A0A4S3IXV1_9EURO|nr:hypothetical protein EYZ11_013358 [Aspergillus tanneri]
MFGFIIAKPGLDCMDESAEEPAFRSGLDLL